MKKNIIKSLLTIACLLCSIGTYAHDFKVDGIYYRLLSEENQVAVTYYGNDVYDVPEEYIYTGSVTIPETVTYQGATYSVTSIGNHAFYGCSGLTEVTIPNSVTSIGERAFLWCEGLTEVTIGNSVTSIGEGAFSGCTGLTEVTIPNSVTLIGESAFYGCTGLTEVTIPNSVTSIGEEAFSFCDGLTEVTIGNSVTSIGERAFSFCDGLTSMVVKEGNTVYDSRDNCNAIIETASNTLITGCKNTVIPNSVTSIGYAAFADCTGLTEVTIPNSVTSIGELAFAYCSGLTEVTIPNSVTSIGVGAFAYCTGLTEITIPNSVTSIGVGAFRGCSGLLQITIPNNVTMIGERAFEDCNNLTIVTIPNSVLSIGNYAFFGCEKLAVMKVKAKNPPAIKEHTFEGVDKTMHLYVPAGMIGKYQSISYWSDFINILEEEPMDVQLTLQNSIYNNVVFYLPYGTMQKLEIKTLDDSYVLNSVVFNGKDVTDEIINDVYVTPELTDDAVLNISYDTSSVENLFLNNNRIKAYGHNGNIVVTGCEYGESIAIYNVDGILLRSLLANSDMMRISMPSESIYMVKVADSAIKVAL